MCLIWGYFGSLHVKILLTGAAGFLGRALWLRLRSVTGVNVVPAIHRSCAPPEFAASAIVAELSAETNWISALDGVNVVIHCAALAHVKHGLNQFASAEFRLVNVGGTLSLARQAATVGVRRFVFISSIGVNGIKTDLFPFTADSEDAPHTAYAKSKYDAENGLRVLAAHTGMEVVIIRPPMVYGFNAPGNFGLLIHWLNRDIPLPLGSVTRNRRSWVALDNLVDLVVTCLAHPRAVNQTFLVSDDTDVSTTEFLRRIEKIFDRRVRLLPVPVTILKTALVVVGKASLAQSLLGSLQVDISKTCGLLNWKPPVSLDEGLRRAVKLN